MKKFRVITGVFEGVEFLGFPINGRIHDYDTIGRSYPVENCIEIPRND